MREARALEARVRRHHHHVRDLLGGLERERALLLGRDVEAVDLVARRALAEAELDAAVRQEVERGERLGDARRVIVVGDDLADAVSEPDALGARRGRGQEHFRRGRVRVLFQEVMLDLPREVDAELVCEHDLLDRFVQQAVLLPVGPRPRQLVLVEDAEFHGPGCHARRERAQVPPMAGLRATA